MTGLEFTKISATGNDFILIDNREGRWSEKDADAFRKICTRRSSVGADGVLLIQDCDDYDFELRYFNADGSESECGNGARAAAFYAFLQGIAPAQQKFRFGRSIYRATAADHSVRLYLPCARDLRENLAVTFDKRFEPAGFVNTGVPHVVLFSEDLETLDVIYWGRSYRYHNFFSPEGTNVNFVRIAGDHDIQVRTYERGVEDETLACGTGTVASAIFANRSRNVRFPVRVSTRGGLLHVDSTETGEYCLEGEVAPVYRGVLL